MRKLIVLIFAALVFNHYSCGQINAYANVSGLTGTSLTVSSVNQTFHNFEVGKFAVLMQMQDDVIGTNTGDAVDFGDLASISSAGLYEIRQIVSIDGNSTPGFTTLTPTTIVLNVINNTYSINANSSLQLISFREMSAGNYTTTANITALDWNGTIGGVIAFEVLGTLTLNHNITANGAGFRGGGMSSIQGLGLSCENSPFRVNNEIYGYKGESIYKSTNVLYNNARAKLITGGGGGVGHNGGGGGGGNYTAGGDGGSGWNGGINCPVGVGFGFGGLSLSASVSGDRIFMGGGGGGGQGNNNAATSGSDGGGIILIKANEIQTTGSCSGRSISANGLNSTFSGPDGAGGGGAAGSIVFFVNTWSVNSTCGLAIAANGGDGGTVNAGIHGGGGAGAQGAIIFNGPIPTTNITTTTLNGSAGCNNNTNPCDNIAGSASGTNNMGILSNPSNPLPVELMFFNATLVSDRVVNLNWSTASEINNAFFIIEKSFDGFHWQELTKIQGAGNSNTQINYTSKDLDLLDGYIYYRLHQVDFDESSTLSDIQSVYVDREDIVLYPNPAKHSIHLRKIDANVHSYSVFDLLGKDISGLISVLNANDNTIELDISKLASGTYVLQLGETFIRFSKID